MESLRRHLGFPLLMKELIEQAYRKRTYVVRFLYAAALFAGGMVAIYSGSGRGVGDVRLGAGQEIFGDLVQMQVWLILLFLPATAAGAFTMEKERDCLALLLITTMPPWSILIQKYLSRLIPMVSFLLLSFPLLAVAYSYGGVGTGELAAAIVVLLLLAAQVAAIAIMCSAFCRSTPEAFVATYVVLVAQLWVCLPASPLFTLRRIGAAGAEHASAAGAYAEVVALCALDAFSIVCYLALARAFLERRAFLPPRNILLQWFQALDEFYTNLNQVTGGVVLVDDGNTLPDARPVAWRETDKKSLGTFRYLFRVLTVIELPILFVGAAMDITQTRQHDTLTYLLYVLWWIAATLICVHASGVVAAERSRQTLDVLLTTPLTGADILRQKMAGVRRLLLVLAVAFVSIFAFQTWFRRFNGLYVAGSLATIAVFLPLLAWLGLWIGLRIRSTMKAVLTSLCVVLSVCWVPLLAAGALQRALGGIARDGADVLTHLSPVTIIVNIERIGRRFARAREFDITPALIGLGVLTLYAAAAWFIRRRCLRHADRLLDRVPEAEERLADRPHSRRSDVPVAPSAAVGETA